MKIIRALIDSATSVTGKLLRLSVSGRTGESLRNIIAIQHYGFASRPLPGAEAIVLVQGNNLVIIGEDDKRYTIELGDDGDVALYNYEGIAIRLKKGKKVEVSGADEINLGGERAGLQQLIDARFKLLFDLHVHSGVSTGGQNSGPPLTPLDLNTMASDTVRAK